MTAPSPVQFTGLFLAPVFALIPESSGKTPGHNLVSVINDVVPEIAAPLTRLKRDLSVSTKTW